MRKVFKLAGLRGLRTMIQALAGVSASFPLVYTLADARAASLVAAWASFGAVVAGVAAFLQNLAEGMEALENGS